MTQQVFDGNRRRSVLVTGGGRGIGAATALLFAQNGYAVCINYARQRPLELEKRIHDLGVPCLSMQADVSDEQQVLQLFTEVDAQFGYLDCLINNAGVIAPQARLMDVSAERLRRMFEVNVLGAFLCAREAVRRMSLANGGKGGSIVNVSSVAARTGSPNEYIDYAATKGAIDTMTKGLSVEVAAQGIRVNAVRPGFIKTEMHADGGEPGRVERLAPNIPLQRGGEPDEVAQAIYWLASDAASYVTGNLLDVAGGR
jgi:NAD(P)-dependent dehydrogenase (short-subunit alcohol dehydrogenase family)